MKSKKAAAFHEGYNKGALDKFNRYSQDVYRHINGWAVDFDDFERGYIAGHNETPYCQLTRG